MVYRIVPDIYKLLRKKTLSDYFMYDSLFIIAFEYQQALKYKQRRNYRHTVFLYVFFLRQNN